MDTRHPRRLFASSRAPTPPSLFTTRPQLTDDRLLAEYKGRHTVERGFRFLKDPLFFASSLFVKSPKRVAAIAMVMGLCLLVYTLGEGSLREALA